MIDLNHSNAAPRRRDNCLGSTCMKWQANGELSAVDFHRILEQIAAVDHNLRPPPAEPVARP